MSLIGITIFPFLVQPIVDQVLNLRFDSATTSRLIEHNSKLFLHGVLSPAT